MGAQTRRKTENLRTNGPHPAIVLPAARPYQNRTKRQQKRPFCRLLALSNTFRINGRHARGQRVKMALYR